MSVVHPVHRVEDFRIVGPYTLSISFEDGLCRVIDFLPVLAGELYGPLRDEALFRQVDLDAQAHTLVWPNGADFDPTTLHDWPEVKDDFTAMAKGWSRNEEA